MHLADFIQNHKMSMAAFGARIGVKRQTVSMYCKGRVPDAKNMAKIIKETGGAVTPNDFFSGPSKRSRRPEVAA